ncbi:VOC family protein [Dongia sp.]|uniref:VOC family protein n=1 Tax=Dongia sp. TaxID=1977262 RepID=UPI003751BC43
MQIHEMYPYFRMKDTAAAIRFYKEAFGIAERFRLVEPSGRIGHVELAFGPNTLMLSDEFPEYGITAPEPADVKMCIHIHVEDCDALMARAIAAGATLVRPAADHFYGERSGAVRDPFGYDWLIGHSIEVVEPSEMQRRYTEMLKNA